MSPETEAFVLIPAPYPAYLCDLSFVIVAGLFLFVFVVVVFQQKLGPIPTNKAPAVS